MSKSLKNDFWNNYMWLSELRKYKILIIAFITIHNGNCCGYLSTAINYYYPVAIVLGATIPAHIRDTLWRCYINLKSVISIKIDNGIESVLDLLTIFFLSLVLANKYVRQCKMFTGDASCFDVFISHLYRWTENGFWDRIGLVSIFGDWWPLTIP